MERMCRKNREMRKIERRDNKKGDSNKKGEIRLRRNLGGGREMGKGIKRKRIKVWKDKNLTICKRYLIKK